MIIDVHTHTFPDAIAQATVNHLKGLSRTQPFTDGSNGGLRASMEAAGINLSILLPVATNPKKVGRINDGAALCNARWRDTGLYSLGCIHPAMENPEGELRRLAELGVKGIKLHPAYQRTNFDHPDSLRILELCGQLDLVVLTHAGVDIGLPDPVYCTPQMVVNALNQVGPVKLVLAHMGGWRQWDDVEALLPQTSVYLDTSFSLGSITPLPGGGFPQEERQMLEEGQFVRLLRAFGAERVLFGTDSPWGGQAESLAQFRALPLTQAEQELVLGQNAQRLFELY